jgi:uncharacterized membrane protein
MSILQDISDLVQHGIITEETAEKIRSYYALKQQSSPNRMFTVFGVLGALLVGLGIILILAHNWDTLSRTVKSIIAFTPLVIAQLLCIYVLFKKGNSSAWRESTAALLFLSVGASISLVSQIYQIPGNVNSFMLTWMVLGLPLIYIMRSSVSSLLYLIGITYFVAAEGYFTYFESNALPYWLMLLLVLPFYYYVLKTNPKGNFTIFHNWFISISLLFALGTLISLNEDLILISYFSLLGIYYLIGQHSFFKDQKGRNNSYRILGSVGTIFLLLVFSFDFLWNELRINPFNYTYAWDQFDLLSAVFLTGTALYLLLRKIKQEPGAALRLMDFSFLFFVLVYFIGQISEVTVLLVNLYVLFVGVATIRDGVKNNHLGILNYGLLIITSLVVCRFFDQDLSFVVRGILFVTVGVGFFVANYSMLKKRKTHV